jgi:hypothetical protein
MANENTGKLVGIGEKRQAVSIEKCRATLSKNGVTYTHEEAMQIRDYLYRMAAAVWNDYQKHYMNRQKTDISMAA